MNNMNSASNYNQADRYFFRTADKMRLEGCVQAVGIQGQNLTLYCEEEALLDHYTQLLLTDLRATTPQHKVEVYFPTSPDNLITRFNEAVRAHKVADASRKGEPGSPGQIWVIHDPALIPQAEMQLLGRLIQTLPGANIRIIVLLAGRAAHDFNQSVLKRQMLRWDIDLPDAEQAMAALEFSEHSGQLLTLRRMLSKICAGHPETADRLQQFQATTEPERSAMATAIVSGPQSNLISADNAKEDEAAMTTAVRTKWAFSKWQGFKIAGLIGAALLVSTGLMMWTQPQAFGLVTATPSTKPVKTTQREPLEIVETATESATKGSSLTANKPAPALPYSPSRASESTGAANATSARAALTPTPYTALPSTAVATTNPPDKQLAATSGSTASTSGQSNGLGRNQDPATAARWFRSLPGQHYVIWYGALKDLEEAKNFRSGYQTLASSVIVTTRRNGQNYPIYAVISEPFETAGLAYQALKAAGYPKSNWVRQVKDVQAELTSPIASERSN